MTWTFQQEAALTAIKAWLNDKNVTCHKAQGSQWDHLIVFDESNSFRENARAWAYTALTRSAEKLIWVLP